MTARRIVLAWREIEGGGGIGAYVRALAGVLAPHLPVTVITGAGQQLDGLLPANVEVITVRDPTEHESAAKACFAHAYSVLVFDAIVARFAEEPPALIEFQDYGAEGLATLQGRQAAHPLLRETRCVVRLNTTSEMVAVLNGAVPADHASQQQFAAEAICLRLADTLLYGGGEIAESYERFYGAEALAPREQLRQPLLHEPETNPWPAADRLELLYLGRMERRKGVDLLVKAMQELERDDVRLTMVGGDTATAPLGGSMGDAAHLSSERDARVRFLPELPGGAAALSELVRASHAVVMPSRWECWPAAALEGFAHNRPLIATQVGGLTEMLADPGAGNPIRAPRSASAIAEAIDAFAEQRTVWAERVAAGRPAARFRELAAPAPVVDWYRAAQQAPGARARWRTPRVPRPLVTIGVPYYAAYHWVEATLQSVRAQTYPNIELIILTDGSFEPDDRVIAQLARTYDAQLLSQPNGGVGTARNTIAAVARGQYVMFLDADNLLAPEFIERGVDVFERDPECGVFSSWLRSIDHRGEPLGDVHGYWPLGHQLGLVDGHNVAGDAAMMVRRSLFAQGLRFSTDLTTYEDHDFYRRLRDAGVGGAVYPAQLVWYRVRPDSSMHTYGLPHAIRNQQELRARRREERQFT